VAIPWEYPYPARNNNWEDKDADSPQSRAYRQIRERICLPRKKLDLKTIEKAANKDGKGQNGSWPGRKNRMSWSQVGAVSHDGCVSC